MKIFIYFSTSFFLLVSSVFAENILEKAIETSLVKDKKFFATRDSKKRIKVTSVKAKERVIPANIFKEALSHLPNLGYGTEAEAFDFISFDIVVQTDNGEFELTCNSSHYYNCGFFSLNSCGDKGVWIRNGSRNVTYDEQKKRNCLEKDLKVIEDMRAYDESAEIDSSSNGQQTDTQILSPK